MFSIGYFFERGERSDLQELIAALLEALADITAKTNAGLTPLHMATTGDAHLQRFGVQMSSL